MILHVASTALIDSLIEFLQSGLRRSASRARPVPMWVATAPKRSGGESARSMLAISSLSVMGTTLSSTNRYPANSSLSTTLHALVNDARANLWYACALTSFAMNSIKSQKKFVQSNWKASFLILSVASSSFQWPSSSCGTAKKRRRGSLINALAGRQATGRKSGQTQKAHVQYSRAYAATSDSSTDTESSASLRPPARRTSLECHYLPSTLVESDSQNFTVVRLCHFLDDPELNRRRTRYQRWQTRGGSGGAEAAKLPETAKAWSEQGVGC